MKTIVIYKTRTGFTKQYAEWISEALNCDIINYKNINKVDITTYDIVIYGGRVHAGNIDKLQNIKKLVVNKNIKLIVFATGATPLAATEQINELMQRNFQDDSIPHFYMQSGLCYEKMGRFDKSIMKLLAKALAGKENKNDIENGTSIAISESHDISSKTFIEPLIECVNNIINKKSAA